MTITRAESNSLFTRQRRLDICDELVDLEPASLAVFPQGKGFFDGLFFAGDASAFDRLADQLALSRGQFHMHNDEF